jgi:hypothetical protein
LLSMPPSSQPAKPTHGGNGSKPKRLVVTSVTTLQSSNRLAMKLKTLIFFYILTILTSCNGQTSNKKINTDLFAKGDTVKELGSSIYGCLPRQEKYHIGLEVGKQECINTMEINLINYTTKHGLL